MFFILAGVFNTAYFLAHFPRQFDFSADVAEHQAMEATGHYTASFKNLTKFILIPIALIYFLILYAFSMKILVTWELPQGWVGKLVLGFSVAGIFTYLLNYLLVKYDDSQLVKAYKRWFFFVLLPMVVLLFVAIGRRISDYGVTEARYVVATSGVWLLLMSLYFIFSKKDNIKFIPISLAFFSLLTVVGPFSAFRASERSQKSRLLAVLEKNNMLKEGKIVPAADSLSQKDVELVRGGIEYLSRNDCFEEVAPMFGLPKDSVPDWQATEKLLSQIGVTSFTASANQCYVVFKEENQRELDVKGFEIAYDVYSSGWSKPDNVFTGFTIMKSGNGLQYYVAGEAKDSFDFQPLLVLLKDRGACNSTEQPDSLAVYRVSGQGREALFHPSNLAYMNSETPQLTEYRGQVMLRDKD
ncbi:MAG: DUF4153 domain-containing protein [Saprospiraceae bacterium]|nr:DUF4153 domain-containing protein [Saprospiraceae bacterium]